MKRIVFLHAFVTIAVLCSALVTDKVNQLSGYTYLTSDKTLSTNKEAHNAGTSNSQNNRNIIQILDEGFEGSFPSGLWSVSGTPTWDIESSQQHTGTSAAWCAGSTLNAAGNQYANNMSAAMVYGPFDLTEASNAVLSFWSKTSTEPGYDSLHVKIGYCYENDLWVWTNVFTEKGEINTWHQTTINSINSFLGYNQVKVSFVFKSDYSDCNYSGSWIDDILLTKAVPIPVLEITPTVITVPNSSGSFPINVSSNVNCTITDDADWITCSPASGSDFDSITISYAENTSAMPRTATVTIIGADTLRQTCSVTQNPNPNPFLTVTPETQLLPSASGNFIIEISSSVEWSFGGSPDWLTLSEQSGIGDAIVTVSFAQNPNLFLRAAILSISGEESLNQTCTITQSAAPYMTINPLSQSVSSTSGSLSITLLSNTNWSALTNVSWITCSPMNGSFSDIVSISYEQNSTTSPRTGTVTFSGTGASNQLLTISQDAAVANEDNFSTPMITKLFENYPNPFSSKTNIRYSVKSPCSIEIYVCNIKGNVVKNIVKSKSGKGDYTINWDGTDNAGKKVGSGIYYLFMKADSYQACKKIVFVK